MRMTWHDDCEWRKKKKKKKSPDLEEGIDRGNNTDKETKLTNFPV